MYFEAWSIVLISIVGLTLCALLMIMVMAVLIAGSKADDLLLEDKQYQET